MDSRMIEADLEEARALYRDAQRRLREIPLLDPRRPKAVQDGASAVDHLFEVQALADRK